VDLYIHIHPVGVQIQHYLVTVVKIIHDVLNRGY